MTNNHRGLYRIKKGFRDIDGTYYRTGTEMKLFNDSHVKTLVREGKLKEIRDVKPESTFRNEQEKREAIERGEDYPQLRRSSERCPEGYHLVLDHYRKRNGRSSMALEEEGVYVSEHCAKDPERRR